MFYATLDEVLYMFEFDYNLIIGQFNSDEAESDSSEVIAINVKFIVVFSVLSVMIGTQRKEYQHFLRVCVVRST